MLPRTTGRAASKPDRARPGRLRWRAAGPTAAHTLFNVVTDAVFHAPMFALNVDALENACEHEGDAAT